MPFSPWKETQAGKEPSCFAFIPGLIQKRHRSVNIPQKHPRGSIPASRQNDVSAYIAEHQQKNSARVQSWECCTGLVLLKFLVVLVRFTLPKTKNMPLKIGFPKRIQDRFPSIHFQGLTVKWKKSGAPVELVWSTSHYLQGFYTSQVVVWDSWTINKPYDSFREA